MSQSPKQEHRRMRVRKNQKGKPITISSFVMLSTLLCLTNLITFARLYQFNERQKEGEDFFSQSKISHMGDLTVQNSRDNPSFISVFISFEYELNLLLPLLFEVSAIVIILFKWAYYQIFKTIWLSVVVILLGFLGIWLYPDQFYIYKATYILHSLFLVPLLISSSFGLIKLIPKKLLRFKGYYVCFMLMLPGFGIPCSFWYMQQQQIYQQEDNFQIIYAAILKLGTVGLLITLVALFLMFDIRKDIIYTFDMRLIQALKTESYGMQMKDQIKGKLQITMSTEEFSRKQTSKIFDSKQANEERPNDMQNKQVIRMPVDKFGGILMVWGIITAIGRQLPAIQKKVIMNVLKTQNKQNYVYTEDHSNLLDEFLFNLLALLISLSLTWIVRRKIQIAMKLIMFCIMGGLFSIFILLLLSQGTLVLTVPNIERFVTVARSCFLAFIIPGLVYSETVGMPASEAATILFLSSWAAELLMRILLGEVQVDTTLYLIGIIILLCCYAIQEIRKGTQTLEMALWQYAKIDDDDAPGLVQAEQLPEPLENLKQSSQSLPQMKIQQN